MLVSFLTYFLEIIFKKSLNEESTMVILSACSYYVCCTCRVEAGLQQIKEPTTFHIKIIGHLLAGPSELRHVTTNFVNGLAHDNQLMNMVSLTVFSMGKKSS